MADLQFILQHDAWLGHGNFGKLWLRYFVQFQDPFNCDDPFTQSAECGSKNKEQHLLWYIGASSFDMWNHGLVTAYGSSAPPPGEASAGTTHHCPAPRRKAQHHAEVRPAHAASTEAIYRPEIAAVRQSQAVEIPPEAAAAGNLQFLPSPPDRKDRIVSTEKGTSMAPLVNTRDQGRVAPAKPVILAMPQCMIAACGIDADALENDTFEDELFAVLAEKAHAAVEGTINALERKLQDQNKEIMVLREQVEHLQRKINKEVSEEDVDRLDTSDGRHCATPSQPSAAKDEDVPSMTQAIAALPTDDTEPEPQTEAQGDVQLDHGLQ